MLVKVDTSKPLDWDIYTNYLIHLKLILVRLL
jgi:hypothetical protein